LNELNDHLLKILADEIKSKIYRNTLFYSAYILLKSNHYTLVYIKLERPNMNTHLIAANEGINLHVLSPEQFSSWLSSQSPLTQQWLEQTKFSKTGLSIIPNNKGNIELALFVIEKPHFAFACGELINQLPEGQYLLKTDHTNIDSVAFAWAIGSYRFTRYKKNDKNLPTLAINNQKVVEKAIKQMQATALVRDLINTPSADMMPEHLSEAMSELATTFNAEFSEIVGDDLLTQNYPTIHAVGRASCHQPRLLDLHWGDNNAPKVTLVGKGVCFDSGGLDLKPASGMRFMKKDMGGAAHVLGLAQLIMSNNLPINLRVLIPAVENAVANNSFRPGDVITTRKGLTVEIDNTDAEGRLVLGDALAEAENDNPELLIDFSTLTGAMRIALGTELPGFFSTNNQIASDLMAIGDSVDDPVWRMPLYQSYNDLFKSDIADMTNCPTVPQGGAICAALYLQAFVNKDTDWLHFDVMAWNNRKLPGRPIGGEAFGIRAMFAYLNNRYN